LLRKNRLIEIADFQRKTANVHVVARERSDRSNLVKTTGLLRLRLAMTVSENSIFVKNIAIFQQSLIVIPAKAEIQGG